MTILINPITQTALDAFLQRPAGALIVSGSRYAGTEHVIDYIKQNILKANQSHVLHVQRDNKNTIGIEKIRELKKWLMTRFSKNGAIERIAVIHDSESMTNEAQNALLKIVEEPPVDTLIILESSERVSLIETVRSRCQTITLLPLPKDMAFEAAKKMNLNLDLARKAYALSGGEALLFEQLMTNDSSDVTDSVASAKLFVQQSQFERLCRQSEYADIEKLSELLNSLERVCEAAMIQSNTQVEKWSILLRTVQNAKMLTAHNTAPKLVYTYISVNL